MRGYPTRAEAERLVAEAESCNPGPWGDHSRVADVKRRYGFYRQDKWDTNLRLKTWFEEKTGRNIYEIVK